MVQKSIVGRLGPNRFVANAVAFILVALSAGCTRTADENGGSEAGHLAVVNGRIFDGTGAPVIEDGIVLVRDLRIVAVGAATDIEIPIPAKRIDAQGGLVMPGVIDNHVHISRPLMRGDDILTPWVEAGVTTLVDIGTSRRLPTALRALAPKVAEHSPRLFLAGPIVTAPDGYPATRSEPGVEMVALGVRGTRGAREAVADLLDNHKVDLIKIAIETGFENDYKDAGWPILSLEEIRVIADATHERGKLVRAHVTQPGELRAAIESGVDVAAHTPIVEIPDDLLTEAARLEVIFVSTANIWGPQSKAYVVSNLLRFHRLGGRVALGTDYPYQAGSEMPVAEMQLLVDAGFTPAEVLVAATRNGAFALGMQDDFGTLEPGKLADIIVVDGDPLTEIADMANVRVVILDGELILP